MEFNIDKSEIRRYLGIKGDCDKQTNALIDKCVNNLKNVIYPRWIYKIFPIEIKDNGVYFKNTTLIVSGEEIKERLSGCKECAVLGATLGIEVDRVIRMAQSTNMAEAVVYDACATEFIEKVCDKAEEEICQKTKRTPRFSAGYGDIPLDTQREVFKIMELEKNVGITLSEELLMTPTKSVTAFIGIGEPKKCEKGCEACLMKKICKFRKER